MTDVQQLKLRMKVVTCADFENLPPQNSAALPLKSQNPSWLLHFSVADIPGPSSSSSAPPSPPAVKHKNIKTFSGQN